MAMKKQMWRTVAVLALLMLIPFSIVLAHGEPVIVVDPTVVAAGGTITVSGSEMENGEEFVITLEGIEGSIALGEATATGESEAGFVVQFTIPDTTTPGSYTVRAATDEGEVATADLTVTAPTEQASAGPATIPQMASADSHELDRTKPATVVLAVLAVTALSAVGGLVLVRRKG